MRPHNATACVSHHLYREVPVMSSRMVRTVMLLALATLLLTTSAVAGTLYRWVDDQGVTNFSQTPPPSGEAEVEEQEIPTFAPPPAREPAGPEVRRKPPPAELPNIPGVLPENARSRLLESKGSYYRTHLEGGKVQITQQLVVKALPGLPKGAYLEVTFPNLLNPLEPYVVGYVRQGSESEMTITSPTFEGSRCGTFTIRVDVYRNRHRLSHLDTLNQGILFRVDSRGFDDPEELFLAFFARGLPCFRSIEDLLSDGASRSTPRGIPLGVYSRIGNGMSMEEVEAIAGVPDKRTSTTRGETVYIYGEPGAVEGMSRIYFWDGRVNKMERGLR